MAKGWLKAIAENPEIRSAVDVVGLVDVNPAAAEALAVEFGLADAVIGSSLADVLEKPLPILSSMSSSRPPVATWWE